MRDARLVRVEGGDRPRAQSPVTGFEVVTMAGEKLGTVAAVGRHAIVVERRRALRRSLRLVPSSLTVVNEDDRKLIVLVSRELVDRAPRLRRRDARIDDEELSFYYRCALALGL